MVGQILDSAGIPGATCHTAVSLARPRSCQPRRLRAVQKQLPGPSAHRDKTTPQGRVVGHRPVTTINLNRPVVRFSIAYRKLARRAGRRFRSSGERYLASIMTSQSPAQITASGSVAPRLASSPSWSEVFTRTRNPRGVSYRGHGSGDLTPRRRNPGT